MKIRIFALLMFFSFTVKVRSQVEVVSTGTGSAYVLNVPAVFPLRNGVQVTFKANVVNAAAPTINVTGTGPILIKKEGGSTNLAAGDIKAGQVVHLVYDGTFWQMLSALGNAVPPGSVTGSGTQNFVTKWNNAGGTSIGNSTIFDDGTNVSIGTTTASSLFHVYGGGTPQITIENIAANFKTGYRIKTASNEWFLGQEGTATSGFRITDIDAAAVRFHINQNDGFIGIGTTAPLAKLHVADNDANAAALQISSATGHGELALLRSRGTVAAPSAVLLNDYLGSVPFLGYNGSDYKTGGHIQAVATENYTGTANGGELIFSTTPNGTDSPLQRMIIKESGRVGIGTDMPGTTLHVAGNNPSSIVNQVAENTSSNIQSGILMQRSRGTVTAPLAVQSGDNLGGFYVMGYDGSAFGTNGPTAGLFVTAAESFTPAANGSNLHFETTALGDNTSTERMIITADGNVGIGTSNPNQKLEVQDGHILLSNTGTQSELRFKEASANGGQIISFKAPSALAANVNYTLPIDDGSANDVLSTDGTGTLSWQPVSGTLSGGTVNYHPKWTSANTLSSTSLVYDDGTNLGIGINTPGVSGGASKYVSMASTNTLSNAPMSLELIGSNISDVSPVTRLDFIHATGGPAYDAIGSIRTFRNSSNTRGSMAFFTADGSGIVERMRIKNNGYVGIGTSDPQEQLHIESTTNVAVSLDASPTGTSRYYMGSTTFSFAGAMEYDNNTNSMNFWTANTPNRLFISGGGNVGIATSTPSSIFSVGSGATSPFQINTSGNIMRINNVATSFPAAQGAAGTYLQNNGAGILTWATISGTLSGGTTNQIPKWTSATSLGNSQISDNGVSVTIATNTNISYTGTSVPALNVNSPSVGTLGAALSVSNTSSLSAANSNLSSIGFGDGLSAYTAFIKGVRDAVGAANDYPTALTFFTTSDGSNIAGERMRLDNAGNLGIGITTPAARLHSSGQIRSGIPSGGLGGAGASTGSILFYNTVTTNTAAIQSGNTTTTYTLTLPPAAPSVANSSLVGAITGVLSWAAPGAAGAGLPSGTSGQTLRHDGANWVANSLLFNDGNDVGIGMTNPAARLHVMGGPGGGGLIAVEGTSAAGGSEINLMTLGTGAAVLNTTGTKGYRIWGYGDGYSTATLQNDYRFAYVNGTGHTPIFNIDISGNVGVGLSSLGSEPLNAMDVGGAMVVGSGYASTYTAPSNGMLIQGKVGIGETAPVEILELSSTDSDIDAETYSTTESSSLHVKRARGTALAPTVPLSGDYFGGLGFQAWDGSTFQEGARVQGAIDGSPAANDMPGRLEFWTALDGTATAVERMRIANTGNVGIGTTLPGSSRLNVVIPSTDASNPIGLTVTNNYTGISTKYGIDVNVDGAGSGAKYGISSSVIGLAGDASSIYGYQVAMTPSGTGTAHGLYSSMSAVGTGVRYGFFNNVTSLSTNTAAVYGISNNASKPSGAIGTLYGIYNGIQNDGTGTSYGILLSNGGTATTKYGVYSTGETDNYFAGNVGLGITAPAFQLQLSTNSAAKPSTGTWTVASDARLKTNIHPYQEGLSELMKIEPVWFTYTGEANMPKETAVGVIAQDLQKVAPHMVKEWTFVPNDPAPSQDGKQSAIQRPEGKKYLGVDNGAMTYMLINAVKEQQAQILELKKTLEEQKKLIEKLEKK
jgi:hypothetical protein